MSNMKFPGPAMNPGTLVDKIQNTRNRRPTGKVKLRPIKEHSAKINVEKAKRFKKNVPKNKKSNADKLGVIEEEKNELFVPNFRDNNFSTMSKRNRRYSSNDPTKESVISPDFKLIEDEEEAVESAYKQLEATNAITEEDDSNRLHAIGTNGRKISIFNIRSPVRNSDKWSKNLIDERGPNIESTL